MQIFLSASAVSLVAKAAWCAKFELSPEQAEPITRALTTCPTQWARLKIPAWEENCENPLTVITIISWLALCQTLNLLEQLFSAVWQNKANSGIFFSFLLFTCAFFPWWFYTWCRELRMKGRGYALLMLCIWESRNLKNKSALWQAEHARSVGCFQMNGKRNEVKREIGVDTAERRMQMCRLKVTHQQWRTDSMFPSSRRTWRRLAYGAFNIGTDWQEDVPSQLR